MTALLDLGQLGRRLLYLTLDRSEPTSIGRVELLPRYDVEADGADFERWQAGAAAPDWERKQLTLDVLTRWRAAGVDARRIRVFSAEMSLYERFACEWGYAINGEAGENIKVLHRGEHDLPAVFGFDSYLVNRRHVFRMHYSDDGRFLGAEEAPAMLRQIRREHDTLWNAAEPFGPWWTRHTELHRRLVS